jgi:hypothetical protein
MFFYRGFTFMYLSMAQKTALRVESIFDDAAEDDGRMQSPEPYEDPLDELEFPESPSPGDDDYEPDGDNYQDDYDCEPDEDDGQVSEDGAYGHNTSSTPPPFNGRKRVRSGSIGADDDAEYKRARKIVKSKGRPKASDYADDVQDVLDSAITHYKVDLLRFDPYPDRTHELAWAKASWGSANSVCDLKIAHNGELVKMASSLTTWFRLCSYSTQITCRGSHLRGEIKTKVKPLVASMYGFEVPTNETIRARNRKLVEELKEEYTFLYKVRHAMLCLLFTVLNTDVYRPVLLATSLSQVFMNTRSSKQPSTFASSRTVLTLAFNSICFSAHFLVLP